MENIQHMDRRIWKLAEKYADQVYLNAMAELYTQEHPESKEELSRSNFDLLESIDSGIGGYLIFLMAQYQLSRRIEHLKQIDDLLAMLVKYCNKTPCLNYSFYTGRGGLVYVLLQRYLLDRDESFLRTAIEIVQPCLGEYLHSDFTTDYFYNGRSGTLLLLWALYKYSGDQTLLEFINRFIARLLRSAQFSEKGIFWLHSEELNIDPQCGFAFGAAGIAYVLNIINQDVNCKALTSFITQISQFIDSQWNSTTGNWGDYSLDVADGPTFQALVSRYMAGDRSLFDPKDDQFWSKGTVGILISGPMLKNKSERHRLKEIQFKSSIEIDAHFPYDLSLDLKSGLSGTSMFLLLTDHPGVGAFKKHILESIEGPVDLKGGLMNGNLGAIYYLVTSIASDAAQENILSPFLHIVADKPGKMIPFLTQSNIKTELVRKIFPKTVSFLEVCCQTGLLEFGNGAGELKWHILLNSFEDYVNCKLKFHVSPLVFERLCDVLRLDKIKLQCTESGRTQLQVFLDAYRHQTTALELLSNDDEWLLARKISLHEKVKLIETKWDWSFKTDYKPMSADNIRKMQNHNLAAGAGEFSCITEPVGKYEIDELPLSLISKVFFYFLTEPKYLSQLIQDVKAFVQLQSYERIKMWPVPEFSNKTIRSIDDILKHIEDIILKLTRSLIYRNILKVS